MSKFWLVLVSISHVTRLNNLAELDKMQTMLCVGAKMLYIPPLFFDGRFPPRFLCNFHL